MKSWLYSVICIIDSGFKLPVRKLKFILISLFLSGFCLSGCIALAPQSTDTKEKPWAQTTRHIDGYYTLDFDDLKEDCRVIAHSKRLNRLVFICVKGVVRIVNIQTGEHKLIHGMNMILDADPTVLETSDNMYLHWFGETPRAVLRQIDVMNATVFDRELNFVGTEGPEKLRGVQMNPEDGLIALGINTSALRPFETNLVRVYSYDPLSKAPLTLGDSSELEYRYDGLGLGGRHGSGFSVSRNSRGEPVIFFNYFYGLEKPGGLGQIIKRVSKSGSKNLREAGGNELLVANVGVGFLSSQNGPFVYATDRTKRGVIEINTDTDEVRRLGGTKDVFWEDYDPQTRRGIRALMKDRNDPSKIYKGEGSEILGGSSLYEICLADIDTAECIGGAPVLKGSFSGMVGSRDRSGGFILRGFTLVFYSPTAKGYGYVSTFNYWY
jgi:hypothetical protein